MCHRKLHPNQEIRSGRQRNCDWVKHSPRMAWELSFLISTNKSLGACECLLKPRSARNASLTKPNRHPHLHHVKILLHTFAQAWKASNFWKHLSYSNYKVWQQSILPYFNFSSTIELGCRDTTDFTLFFLFVCLFFHQRGLRQSKLDRTAFNKATKNVILVIIFIYCTRFSFI